MEENGVAGIDRNGTESFNMNEEIGRCFSSCVDEGSAETHKYFLSRRTVLEMLKDRGFSVPSSEINLSLQEFRAIYGPTPDIDRLKFSATHLTDPSKRILVMFGGPGVIKVSTVRFIAGEIVHGESITGLILILQSQMTNQAQKAMDLFKFKVEMFQITDLLINITKHVLKPRHQVLTAQEKEKLLKDYSIEEKQLPRLLKNDAIARYYGLEKGQVVKVTYSGDVTESHVTYRCVW